MFYIKNYCEMGLFKAIEQDNLKELRRLLEEGANANIVEGSNKENTPLHFAIESNNEDMVRELLQPNWNVNLDIQNGNGDTPLHAAALGGRDRFIHLLWERQAVSNITNKEGMTFVDIIRKQAFMSANRQMQEDFFNKYAVPNKSIQTGKLNVFIYNTNQS